MIHLVVELNYCSWISWSGLNKIFNQATTDNVTTPLCIASQSGNLQLIKELISNRANVNQATTDYGYSPLHISCQEGYLEVIKELINNDPNLNQTTNDDGRSPLFIASYKGYLK